ncbi:MAG: ABC transporter permease [Muribaculaceae bacterium]|nr:ABC transporter permease [Muribaculaceae bacterium]
MLKRYLIESYKRGCVQLVRRPMYFIMMVIVPLFSAWFLLNLMDQGGLRNVPVGIVDYDNSDISRRIYRNLNAFEQVDVKYHFSNFAEAKKAVKRGEVMGFFLIPDHFSDDALGGRQPVVSYYVNYAYFPTGSMTFKGFKTISLLTSGGIVQTALRTVGMPKEEMQAAILPYEAHYHMRGNPYINYNYYLSLSFVPCFLALFVMLVTAFSIGVELKTGLCKQWLRVGGGSITLALSGKLVPQTIVFTAVGWAVQWLMYCHAGLPLNCPPWHMLVAMMLFVMANQGFAVLMMCVAPHFRYGSTLCTLFGMLSFSFCGFSLPQEAMYPWVETIGFLMPIKYYFLLSIDQALNGIPIYYSRYYYVALVVFIVLPMFMVWRLKNACKNPVYLP